MAFSQHAFFLTDGGHALSATCFMPETVCGAVLFVPPFVEERKGALPVFVQTARALAERRIASLLFDFSGNGDSEGVQEETPPSLFEADGEAASAWLDRMFPDLPHALIGVRTGALLAARLAVRHSGTAALVQWAPVAGTDLIRQLLQRRMVNDMVAYGKARESRAALEARLRAGETVDLDGYAMTGAFYTWLQALTPQPAAGLPVCIAAGGHDAKTAAACTEQAQNATVLDFRYPPFWNTVGHVDLTELVDTTADWVSQRLNGTPRPAPEPAWQTSGADGAAVSLGADTAVRGMFDLPDGTPKAGVLFLHGWSGDRTGPHRLFTRFARTLAREGYLCLRPDFTGRGLSDGAAGEASIARMADNAEAALETLRNRLPPDAPVIVTAICSGCKVAVTLAARQPGIAKLLLWSAESMGDLRSAATGLRKMRNLLKTYAKKLTRPETWKKILSGRVQTRMVTQALVKQEVRSPAEAAWENDVLMRFRTYRHPVCFVFGGSDPDAPGSMNAYTRYCRKYGIPHTCHLIAHAGHSYYSETWTRELIALSRTELAEV